MRHQCESHLLTWATTPACARIDPGDVIVLGRTGADVHMIGLQAHITRDGQAACGQCGIFCRESCRNRSPEPATHQHRDYTETPERHSTRLPPRTVQPASSS